jgi:hypothetical protein
VFCLPALGEWIVAILDAADEPQGLIASEVGGPA